MADLAEDPAAADLAAAAVDSAEAPVADTATADRAEDFTGDRSLAVDFTDLADATTDTATVAAVVLEDCWEF